MRCWGLIALLVVSTAACSKSDGRGESPEVETPPVQEAGGGRPAGAIADSSAIKDATRDPSSDSAARPITSLSQIERGTPKDWLLYDLGAENNAPYDVHADEDGVYWVQHGGKIYRGSHDGQRTPEAIGEFASGAGYGLASDSQHLYWLTMGWLRRVPKAGGEVEQIDLRADHTGGDLTVDSRYVYVAQWGCETITRIDKKTLTQEEMSITVERRGVGSTTIRLDGDEIFCASWRSVFAIPAFGQPARTLVSDATTVYGMAVLPQDIYWIDRNGEAGHVLFIGRVARTGGKPETFNPSEPALGWGTFGFAHSPGGPLYFIADNWIASFSPDTKHYSIHALDSPSGYLATHGDFLYLTITRGPSSVKRMPLSHTPLYTLP